MTKKLKKALTISELCAIIVKLFETAYAPVAQLDRVSDYESEGQGFESLLARHDKRPTICWPFIFCIEILKRLARDCSPDVFYHFIFLSSAAFRDKAFRLQK